MIAFVVEANGFVVVTRTAATLAANFAEQSHVVHPVAVDTD